MSDWIKNLKVGDKVFISSRFGVSLRSVWKVKCTQCPCDMGRLWFKLKTDAIKAWNTRPPQKEEQNG